MGNACCRASPNGDDVVTGGRVGIAPADPSGGQAQGRDAGGSGDGPTSAGRHQCHTSALDGWASDIEEEWHDALSEVDLAEALEEWEEGTLHGHDAGVDRAIEVLKAHGHLLPSALEAQAEEQRTAEREAAAAAAAEIGARVTVAPAGAVPKHQLELPLSQRLRLSLSQPAVGKLLASAAELAAAGRVLGARAAAQAAAAVAGGTLSDLASLPAETLATALPEGAALDVAQVEAEAAAAEAALASLEDHAGWMVSRDDSLKVYYRHQKGTSVHGLYFSAVFDHALEHLLALAHEFDLIVTWNKFSLASIKLAEPTIFESFVYGAQWMMRPFKPMQALLHARGFDLADEHRCLLVAVQDCTPEELPEGHTPLPPEWPKRKLVNILPGSCIRFKPLPAAADGTPRTEGTMMIHMDPHIPYIPAFLLNFVLGVLAPYIFNQMRKVLDSSFADPQGPYPRRIAEQPHLYGLVKKRMAEFWAELSPRASSVDEAAGGGGDGSKRRRRRNSTPSPDMRLGLCGGG